MLKYIIIIIIIIIIIVYIVLVTQVNKLILITIPNTTINKTILNLYFYINKLILSHCNQIVFCFLNYSNKYFIISRINLKKKYSTPKCFEDNGRQRQFKMDCETVQQFYYNPFTSPTD